MWSFLSSYFEFLSDLAPIIAFLGTLALVCAGVYYPCVLLYQTLFTQAAIFVPVYLIVALHIGGLLWKMEKGFNNLSYWADCKDSDAYYKKRDAAQALAAKARTLLTQKEEAKELESFLVDCNVLSKKVLD